MNQTNTLTDHIYFFGMELWLEVDNIVVPNIFQYNTQYNILYWVLFGFPFQNKYCFDYCLFFLLVLKYCFGYCLFFRWDGDIVLFIAWLLILGGNIVLVIVCCFNFDFLIVLYIVWFFFWVEILQWLLVAVYFPLKYFIG